MKKDYILLNNKAVIKYNDESCPNGLIKEVSTDDNCTIAYNFLLKIKGYCNNCSIRRIYNRYYLFKNNNIYFYNDSPVSLYDVFIKVKIPNNITCIEKSMKFSPGIAKIGKDRNGYIVIFLREIKARGTLRISFENYSRYNITNNIKNEEKSKSYCIAIIKSNYHFYGINKEKNEGSKCCIISSN